MWPSCCCSSTGSVLSSCSNRRVKESNVSNRNLLLTCLRGADVLKKENDRRKTLLVSSDTVHPVMLLGFDWGSDWDWPMSLYIADIMMPAQEKVWTSVSDALLLLRVFLFFFMFSLTGDIPANVRFVSWFWVMRCCFIWLYAIFSCTSFPALHLMPACCVFGINMLFDWVHLRTEVLFFLFFNHFTIHASSKLCAAASEV